MNQLSNDTIPQWLPNLILLEEYGGDWSKYLEVIYTHFRDDFIINKTYYNHKLIRIRREPLQGNKECTFWHIISEGKEEEDRLPDLRRCEKIHWIKPLLESSSDVLCWEITRAWKGKQQRRILVALDDFSYLVVLGFNKNNALDLITAYPIERSHERRKKSKEYKEYVKKKEGAAV